MEETVNFMKNFDKIQHNIHDIIAEYDNHNMRLMILMMLKRFCETNIEYAYNTLKKQAGEEYANELISDCNKGISELSMTQTKIEKGD